MMIENAFELCKSQQKNDKSQIRQLREDKDLKEQLLAFYKDKIVKADEDTQILFNWFIGSNFNVSILELNTLWSSQVKK